MKLIAATLLALSISLTGLAQGGIWVTNTFNANLNFEFSSGAGSIGGDSVDPLQTWFVQMDPATTSFSIDGFPFVNVVNQPVGNALIEHTMWFTPEMHFEPLVVPEPSSYSLALLCAIALWILPRTRMSRR